jgi:hypothetical protein
MNLLRPSRIRQRNWRRLVSSLSSATILVMGGYIAATAVGSRSQPQLTSRESHALHTAVISSASAKGVAIKYVQGGQEIHAGSVEGGYTACPSKYIAIAGGFFSEDSHVVTISSNPFNSGGKPLPTPPNAWGFTFANSDSVARVVSTFVVCELGARYVK